MLLKDGKDEFDVDFRKYTSLSNSIKVWSWTVGIWNCAAVADWKVSAGKKVFGGESTKSKSCKENVVFWGEFTTWPIDFKWLKLKSDFSTNLSDSSSWLPWFDFI